MLWLASYPRSGNTFFRIVLSEVYGIESSEFYDPQLQATDRTYLQAPVVKTHLLPYELLPKDASIPAVYLVRDGRDAVVSTARHHCDLVKPGAPFVRTLVGAIWARPGSYFGGWSRHVRLWRKRAALILRFEDLIADPLGTVEQVRAIYPLPPPRTDRVPSFADLRAQPFDFGPYAAPLKDSRFREKFFRRGKIGAWRDEMPLFCRFLFYCRHGRVLREMGYT
ncbi:MAG: sulfotransferase domain-containing protein [Gemmataceae bacterium]|nr:sulfotransferase domain-containing protein [Gemmataceae bacterium]MDW8265785.1 sulfotransferase domain-containing protein [Gemmataceae bacterium]